VAATVASLAALLVYVVGRFTRLDPPKALVKAKKSKKFPTAEEAEIETESKYQSELFEREQVALSNVIRVSAGLAMAYVVLTTSLSLPAALISLGTNQSSGHFLLSAFWLVSSVAIELRGANYLVSQVVPKWVKNSSWNLGFGILAGAVLVCLKAPNWGSQNAGLAIANAIAGAVALFAVPDKIADRFPGSGVASKVSSGVMWVGYIGVAAQSAQWTTDLFSLWLTIVAAALFAKAWLSHSRLFALLAALVGNVAAVALLMQASAGNNSLLAKIILTISIAVVWFVATRMLEKRFTIQTVSSSWILLANLGISAGWLASHWSSLQPDTTALLLTIVLAAGAIWFRRSRFANANDNLPFSIGSIVWPATGFVILAKGNYDLLHADWSIYSLAVFGLALWNLSKAKHIAEIVSAGVSATLAAVVVGRWSLDATLGAQIINPFVFLGLSLAFSLIIQRVGKTSSQGFIATATVSFAAVWVSYMIYKGQLTTGFSAQAALLNSTWTVAVFSIFASVLLVLRLRKPVQKKFGQYFGFAGVVSWAGSLLAGTSVGGTWISLVLLTWSFALGFVLCFATAVKQKSRQGFWVAYALALSAIASVQATILALPASGVASVWAQLVVPISLALALIVYTLMKLQASKLGMQDSWITLPSLSVAAAFLALLTPTLAEYYASDRAGSSAVSGWVVLIGYLVLGGCYFSTRLAAKNSDASRALLSSAVIAFLLALWQIISTGNRDTAVQLSVLLGSYALMLLVQSLLKNELRTTFYGSGLLIGSLWLAINQWTVGSKFVLVEYYSLSGVSVFALGTWLIQRAQIKRDFALWHLMLPVVYLAGTVIGLSQFSGRNFAFDWVQVGVADLIGIGAFFGSRLKFKEDGIARTRALRALGVVSWALALYVNLNDGRASDWSYEGQLLREVLVETSISATLLIFARLERSRTFLIAGYITSVLAGSVAGGYLNFVVSLIRRNCSPHQSLSLF